MHLTVERPGPGTHTLVSNTPEKTHLFQAADKLLQEARADVLRPRARCQAGNKNRHNCCKLLSGTWTLCHSSQQTCAAVASDSTVQYSTDIGDKVPSSALASEPRAPEGADRAYYSTYPILDIPHSQVKCEGDQNTHQACCDIGQPRLRQGKDKECSQTCCVMERRMDANCN